MKILKKIIAASVVLVSFNSLAATNQITGRQVASNTLTDNNLANGSVGHLELTDNDVWPADLKHLNAPTDEFCVTYETTGDQLEYQACASSPTLDDVYNNSASGSKSITVDDGAVTLNASGTNKGLVITQSGTGNQAEIGNVTVQSDNDLVVPSAIIANRTAPFFSNLTITTATTTTTDDSVKITCGTASCSATNPGYAGLNSVTSGQITIFTITSDVTIKLTGAHWGYDSHGNVSGVLLNVLFDNDNGTLRTCAALIGGSARATLLTTDTNATQASVTQPEHVLCNTAVGSASNTVATLGYFRSDYADAGDVWANQTGIGDFVLGSSSEGMWQNAPATAMFGAGFSVDPTIAQYKFMLQGRTAHLNIRNSAAGTSNNTTYTQLSPIKARVLVQNVCTEAKNASADLTAPAEVRTAADSATLTLFKDLSAAAWTNTGSKFADFNIFFEIGPAASFTN